MTRFQLPGVALLLSSLVACPVGAADDLPTHALARLGSPRLRHAMAIGSSLAFSPDGKTLVSTAGEGQIRLWDVTTGKEVRSFDGHRGAVRAVYFLDGGKQLLSGGGDGTIRLWDVATGKQLRAVPHGPGGIYTLLLSADQRTLLKVGPLGEVQQLDLADDQKVRPVVQAVGGPAPVVALSPDGKLVAVTRLGQPEVVLFDVKTGKPTLRIPRGRQIAIHALSFSADGKELASFGSGPAVTVWDVATGKPSAGRADVTTGGALSGAFSPDGRFLIGVNTSAMVWGAASGQMLRQLELGRARGPQVFAQSPDGRLLAVADGFAIRLWDVAADRELFDPPDHTGEITAARFTPDGARVTTVGRDLRVCQWDPATGRRTFATGPPSPFAQKVLLGRDGQTLFFNGSRGINVLRVGERGEGRTLNDGSRGHFEPIAVSPDGRKLLGNGYVPGGQMDVVFDLDTGTEAGRVRLAPEVYGPIPRALSPDNRTLAGVFYGNDPLRFYDLSGGTVPVPTHDDGPGFRVKGMPLFLTYSSDGKALVVGTQEPSLWEVATGRPRFRMAIPPTSYPSQSAFSADGTLLAVGTHVGTVHVFATATGQELGRLDGQQGQITALDFAPDGARLLSGAIDTTTVVWDVKEWRDRARPVREEVKEEEVPGLWKDLADADAVKGYRAVLALAASPKRAVPYLAERMPRAGPSTERIELLIRDLDSDDFDTREKASADLDTLGVAALPTLRRALEKTESAEVRDRITKLLQKYKGVTVDLNEVRIVRSLEVLERIGTPDAVAALEAVAKIDAKWRLSQDAKAAVGRLARRPAKP